MGLATFSGQTLAHFERRETDLAWRERNRPYKYHHRKNLLVVMAAGRHVLTDLVLFVCATPHFWY